MLFVLSPDHLQYLYNIFITKHNYAYTKYLRPLNPDTVGIEMDYIILCIMLMIRRWSFSTK